MKESLIKDPPPPDVCSNQWSSRHFVELFHILYVQVNEPLMVYR